MGLVVGAAVVVPAVLAEDDPIEEPITVARMRDLINKTAINRERAGRYYVGGRGFGKSMMEHGHLREYIIDIRSMSPRWRF